MSQPVPKKRTSKSKRDSRRSQWKAIAPSLNVCPQCQHPKLPYTACSFCGYYKGRKVIKSEEERKKKEEE